MLRWLRWTLFTLKLIRDELIYILTRKEVKDNKVLFKKLDYHFFFDV